MAGQMHGEIDCKAPSLQLLRHKAMVKLRSWSNHDFLHMKRDWNQSADRLASEALQREKGMIVVSDQDRQDLITLNRLDELLIPSQVEQVVKVAAITRSAVRRRCQPEILQEEIVQQVRIDRIRQAQDEESWISNLKTYLIGDVARLSAEEAKICALSASDYEVDQSGLLLYCPESAAKSEGRAELARFVSNSGYGSHSVITAVIQRKYRAVIVGRFVLQLCDRESEFVQNCTDDRRKL